MDWKEIVTLIGIGATLLVGLMNTIQTKILSKKNTFINTITIARKEYMITLRKAVTELCIAAENKDNKKLKELSYKLKMLMNPAGDDYGHWDREAIKMIDNIVKANDKTDNKANDKDMFVTLMQSWLALEWRGMREECKHGIMSKKKVKKLQKEYYQQYKNFIKLEYNGQKQHTTI